MNPIECAKKKEQKNNSSQLQAPMAVQWRKTPPMSQLFADSRTEVSAKFVCRCGDDPAAAKMSEEELLQGRPGMKQVNTCTCGHGKVHAAYCQHCMGYSGMNDNLIPLLTAYRGIGMAIPAGSIVIVVGELSPLDRSA